MCNCTDEVWTGQPDSQRIVDVEGGSCVHDTGCSTVVLTVQHITWTAYERATSRGRHTETSERSRTAQA